MSAVGCYIQDEEQQEIYKCVAKTTLCCILNARKIFTVTLVVLHLILTAAFSAVNA